MSAGTALPKNPTRQVPAAVTALFVPGDRPERFAKAASSGADVVIIDLEDAVAPAAKESALAETLRGLSGVGGSVKALVRVNPPGSPSFETEVRALLHLAGQDDHGVLGLVVPKAEETQEFRDLVRRCQELDLAVVPLVESAAGILDAPSLARVPGVTRLAFGAIDYALDIDAGSEDRFLDHARSILVVASRAAGIAAPLDSPSISINDTEKIGAASLLARGFGFGGKLCIHPGQVPIVADAFTPSTDEVQWARSVVSASEGASQVNGQMIDRPVVERAQRIIARAGRDL